MGGTSGENARFYSVQTRRRDLRANMGRVVFVKVKQNPENTKKLFSNLNMRDITTVIFEFRELSAGKTEHA